MAGPLASSRGELHTSAKKQTLKSLITARDIENLITFSSEPKQEDSPRPDTKTERRLSPFKQTFVEVQVLKRLIRYINPPKCVIDAFRALVCIFAGVRPTIPAWIIRNYRSLSWYELKKYALDAESLYNQDILNVFVWIDKRKIAQENLRAAEDVVLTYDAEYTQGREFSDKQGERVNTYEDSAALIDFCRCVVQYWRYPRRGAATPLKSTPKPAAKTPAVNYSAKIARGLTPNLPRSKRKSSSKSPICSTARLETSISIQTTQGNRQRSSSQKKFLNIRGGEENKIKPFIGIPPISRSAKKSPLKRRHSTARLNAHQKFIEVRVSRADFNAGSEISSLLNSFDGKYDKRDRDSMLKGLKEVHDVLENGGGAADPDPVATSNILYQLDQPAQHLACDTPAVVLQQDSIDNSL